MNRKTLAPSEAMSGHKKRLRNKRQEATKMRERHYDGGVSRLTKDSPRKSRNSKENRSSFKKRSAPRTVEPSHEEGLTGGRGSSERDQSDSRSFDDNRRHYDSLASESVEFRNTKQEERENNSGGYDDSYDEDSESVESPMARLRKKDPSRSRKTKK